MRLVSFALLLPLLGSLAGCAQQKDGAALEALEARLKAAEEKIATLEKAPARATPSQATPADPAKEEAATKMMSELQDKMKANDYDGARATLETLTKEYPDTRAGKAAVRMGPEIKLVGSDATQIEVTKWFTGKQAKLGDSKATLLVFWEVWCPHCKKEVPKLPEMQAKYKSKGMQVVALTKVSKSSTDEKVDEFIKEHKLEGVPMGKETEDGAMSKAYAVSGIPAAAIVKDGKVIWRGHPARLTDELVEKLLAG